MAQTKRKRRTKHRGNAAGMVETRGRTGRPGPNAAPAKKGSGRARVDRYSQPPTWRGSVNRAALATVLFIVVVAVIGQPIATAIAIGLVMFLIYVPIAYYTDNYLYNRRQRTAGKGKV
ncbi:MAG TPA: hypothetical protein VFT50_01270 [Baekduia sp.]|nr:hypothetical protein [Baekduia sp.]